MIMMVLKAHPACFVVCLRQWR